jgi:hypothetical protein
MSVEYDWRHDAAGMAVASLIAAAAVVIAGCNKTPLSPTPIYTATGTPITINPTSFLNDLVQVMQTR